MVWYILYLIFVQLWTAILLYLKSPAIIGKSFYLFGKIFVIKVTWYGSQTNFMFSILGASSFFSSE